MKQKYLLLFLMLVLNTGINAQSNLKFYANWHDPSLPVASPGNLNLMYSGCWGMAVNGHEYAILGGAGDVLVFDVTNPASTYLRNKFPGTSVTIWREFKSYKNRLYAVTDGADEGLTIYDFSQAPDTIIKTYSSTEFNGRSHTITLDTVSGRIYLNGGSSGSGITVLSVKDNPDQPVLLAKIPVLPGGYIHDSYVRNDTLYASSGYNGYYVYDFKTDVTAPVLIGSTSTMGYNHNSWLSSDGRYAYYTEEIPRGRPVQIVDLANLAVTGEMELVGNGFLDNQVPGGTEAIPHNVYIKDNLLFNSQYEDGLLIYDISEPTNPVLKWKYDTHPQNSIYNGYFGNWGNYPWLPSGTIIAGDMQNGLYILGMDSTSSVAQPNLATTVDIAPNPATNNAVISLPDFDGSWDYSIFNATGQVVRSGNNIRTQRHTILTEGMMPGLYYVEIRPEHSEPVLRRLSIQ